MDTQPDNAAAPQQLHRIDTGSHRLLRRSISGMLAAVLIGAGVLAYTEHNANGSTSPTSYGLGRPNRDTTTAPDSGLPMQTGSATAQATDASDSQETGLVYINTTLDYGSGRAAGTGMILTSDGEILTNHHVVEGATTITAQVVSTGKTYTADVVGYDATKDVAVLQLRGASGLDTVTIDSTSTVQVGDTVVGVGNANGDGGAASAAAGAVTAVDQSITVQSETGGDAERLGGLIKVDADIIAGDSGGPLYDSNAKVIGMDTAASSGTAAVVGYAIPIGTALSIADSITAGQESGTVAIGYPAFLGVELSSLSIRPGYPSGSDGAVIAGTVDGSPAAETGIAAGDTITALGDTTVSSAATLSSAVATHQPGDSVRVTWADASGSTHTATVTLAQGPVS